MLSEPYPVAFPSSFDKCEGFESGADVVQLVSTGPVGRGMPERGSVGLGVWDACSVSAKHP